MLVASQSVGFLGAGPAGGLVWTVLTSTRVGVVQPRTPTSPAALAPEWSEPVMLMTADASGLSGAGASAKVVAGHADTDTRIGSLSTGIVGGMLAGRANASLPFTLAFGGSGGSNGGRGGGSTAVYDQTNPEITRSFVGPVYNDERVSVLRGGSSGAVGGQLPLSRFLRHADMAGTAPPRHDWSGFTEDQSGWSVRIRPDVRGRRPFANAFTCLDSSLKDGSRRYEQVFVQQVSGDVKDE